MVVKKVKEEIQAIEECHSILQQHLSKQIVDQIKDKKLGEKLLEQIEAGPQKLWDCAPLLRLLTESVQLGPQRFRELVKTTFVQLHNLCRENNKSDAADDLVIAVFEVLMFELNMRDDIDTEKLQNVWLQLTVSEDSPIYCLASYIFYSALGLSDKAVEEEIKLCNFKSLSDKKFIEFFELYLHIPLVLFQPTGARLFFDRVLDYYVVNDKISQICTSVLKFPELRNSFLPFYESTFFPSLLINVLQHCQEKATTRNSENDKQKCPQIKDLIDLLLSYRRFTVENNADYEFFKKLFIRCTSTFNGFIFTKEMKASNFPLSLIAMREIVSSFSAEVKSLLIAVMPFALAIPSSEEMVADIQKVYSDMLKDISSDYLDMLFADHEIVDNFLSKIIKLSNNKSLQVQQSCAQVVATFLHSDWTFIFALLKHLSKGKSIDNLGGYKNLLQIFSKALRNPEGIPRMDTVLCYQIWINVYQMEGDTLKSKEFSPKKGLKFLYQSLANLLQQPTFSPKYLSSQSPVISTIVLDLLSIFIQTCRLCLLVGNEVPQKQEAVRNLLEYFLTSCNFAEEEKSKAMERLVTAMLTNAYACGLKGYFSDIDKLVNITAASISDELLLAVVKELDESELKSLKIQMIKKYTVEMLTEDRETRNHIFAILYALTQTRFSGILEGIEDYVYDIFAENDCCNDKAMKFATAYLNVIRGNKKFGEFVTVITFTASNILSSQKFYPVLPSVLAELKRSLSVAAFFKYIVDLPPKITILVDQFPLIGRLIAEMITNLMRFRHLINDISTNQKRSVTDPIYHEMRSHFDCYQKQLSNLTKQIVALKNPMIIRQLPFIISNCLTGEREGNLPTYNLLSGCDEASISLLSTCLPVILKRRFAVMFPSFVESNRFTG